MVAEESAESVTLAQGAHILEVVHQILQTQVAVI